MTGARPLWLAAPGRFAATDRRWARPALVAIGLALLLAMILAPTPMLPIDASHDALVSALRHGGRYYVTVSDLAPGDPGVAAPTRVPALPQVQATLPGWALGILLAILLAALLWNGWSRVAELMRASLPRAAGVALLAVGLVAGTLSALAQPPAGWAALLVTLALLLRTRTRWVEAAAIGAAATLVDPSALVATVALAGCALASGARREAMGWLAATLVGAAALATHWATLATLSLPPVAGEVLPGSGGAALLLGAAFPMLPAPLAGAALVLATLGWGAATGPLAARVLAVLGAGLLATALFGSRAAMLAAPMLPIGLALVPDALADLWRAGASRRRITVTRVVRLGRDRP